MTMHTGKYTFFASRTTIHKIRNKLYVLILLSFLYVFSSCLAESAKPNPFDPRTPQGLLLNQILGAPAQEVSCASSGECVIMITTSGYSPDFKSAQNTTSGVQGADLTCQREAASKGFHGQFKALIVAIGEREAPASGAKDWVLAANTKYYSQYSSTQSRVFLGTTTANQLFSFPLQASLGASGSVADQMFTGLNTNWTSSGNDCSGWTNATSGNFDAGWTGDTANTALNFGTGTCSATNLARLACVEQ